MPNTILTDTRLGMSMRFEVTVDDLPLGSWTKVDGLNAQWDPVEYRRGDQFNELVQLPGNTKYSPVKLARAACADSEKVQQWLSRHSVDHDPVQVVITLKDHADTKVATWTLRDAMPTKWDVAGFDANGKKVAVETLVLAHQGFGELEDSVGASGKSPGRYGMGMRFVVEVDRTSLGEWNTCKGLSIKFKKYTKSISGGDYDRKTLLMDKTAECGDVTLTRVVTDKGSRDLILWLMTKTSTFVKGEAVIRLMDHKNAEVASWELVGVFPLEWQGPTLDAGGKKIATETLKLAYEEFLFFNGVPVSLGLH